MEKLNFIERIQEILKIINKKEGDETFHLHVGLRDFLSYVKRTQDKSVKTDIKSDEFDDKISNKLPMTASIGIKLDGKDEDSDRYEYVLFDDDNGNPMAIIQDGIRYKIPPGVIIVPESHLERYVLDWIREIEDSRSDGLEEKTKQICIKDSNELLDKLKNGEITIDEFFSKSKRLNDNHKKAYNSERTKLLSSFIRIEQEKNRAQPVGLLVLNKFLDEYKEIMERVNNGQQEEIANDNKKILGMSANIAGMEGESHSNSPRPDKEKRENRRNFVPEFRKRFDDFEEFLGPAYRYIYNGPFEPADLDIHKFKKDEDFRAYYYDLAQNKKGEEGLVLVLEPKDLYGKFHGTIITCLNNDVIQHLNDKVVKELVETGKIKPEEVDRLNSKDIEEVKQAFIRIVLADRNNKDYTTMAYHTEKDYEGFKNRVKYYATGNKELLKPVDRKRVAEKRDRIMGR